MPQAVRASVDVWGDDPHIVIELIHLPAFPSPISVTTDDYALAPRDNTPGQALVPDPAALRHSMRRLIYQPLDVLLSLVMTSSGPITGAVIRSDNELLSSVRLELRPVGAGLEMDLPEWQNALRVITTWLLNWGRRPEHLPEATEIREHADTITGTYQRPDERREAIARVLGGHVVTALNRLMMSIRPT